ncbi:MAG: tRNA lysidine(34) synthetase TilS [Burkholderiales bacterium]|nr:tRNA lysidine(34) synthetase TilS [Burkholderiales bacterium]
MRRSDDTDPVRALREVAARVLAAHVPAGAPIAVALSGGRDSVVLLDALAHVAAERQHPLKAIHVHHGLSPHAHTWADFCVSLCGRLEVPLDIRAVTVPRAPRTSLEGEARRLRYAALTAAAAAAGVRFVALAHHLDDQAETLLLQLLRGSGARGLAGMGTLREEPPGIAWLRPLLEVPRALIDVYAHATQLTFVDDESNADTRHRRNALRHSVMPALAAVAPDPARTLARAAGHQAESARLADDLAILDAGGDADATTLARAVLSALAPHRARNVLRWFLRRQGLPAPSTARLAAMLAQLTGARDDARVSLIHAGVEIGVHRGRIAAHLPSPPPFDLEWRGESELVLQHGTLAFVHGRGVGLDTARLSCADVHIRSRRGGERLQRVPGGPRQALKELLREQGVAHWDRLRLPLVYCGDALAAVPGVGIDVAFRAEPASPGVLPIWHPRRL